MHMWAAHPRRDSQDRARCAPDARCGQRAGAAGSITRAAVWTTYAEPARETARLRERVQVNDRAEEALEEIRVRGKRHPRA